MSNKPLTNGKEAIIVDYAIDYVKKQGYIVLTMKEYKRLASLLFVIAIVAYFAYNVSALTSVDSAGFTMNSQDFVTSLVSTNNCILLSDRVGDIQITFNLSCMGNQSNISITGGDFFFKNFTASFDINLSSKNICYSNGTGCKALNPFNQSLNTTSNVTFNNLTITQGATFGSTITTPTIGTENLTATGAGVTISQGFNINTPGAGACTKAFAVPFRSLGIYFCLTSGGQGIISFGNVTNSFMNVTVFGNTGDFATGGLFYSNSEDKLSVGKIQVDEINKNVTQYYQAGVGSTSWGNGTFTYLQTNGVVHNFGTNLTGAEDRGIYHKGNNTILRAVKIRWTQVTTSVERPDIDWQLGYRNGSSFIVIYNQSFYNITSGNNLFEAKNLNTIIPPLNNTYLIMRVFTYTETAPTAGAVTNPDFGIETEEKLV